jgi:hypothetical protein
MICGTETNFSLFQLKPNEILVYAYPYFKKGKTHKAKVKFYDASSKEFNISIDEKIIKINIKIYYGFVENKKSTENSVDLYLKNIFDFNHSISKLP